MSIAKSKSDIISMECLDKLAPLLAKKAIAFATTGFSLTDDNQILIVINYESPAGLFFPSIIINRELGGILSLKADVYEMCEEHAMMRRDITKCRLNTQYTIHFPSSECNHCYTSEDVCARARVYKKAWNNGFKLDEVISGFKLLFKHMNSLRHCSECKLFVDEINMDDDKDSCLCISCLLKDEIDTRKAIEDINDDDDEERKEEEKEDSDKDSDDEKESDEE